MRTEQEKGGKLISSIESLDFFVNSEEDVEIGIKDSDDWKLESVCPMVSCTFLFVIMSSPYSIQHGERELNCHFNNKLCNILFDSHV